MKGLLLKDFYTLLKQTRVFILLILLFAVMPGESMSGFAIVYAALLPLTALAYDERSKWDNLAAMMPYSPREIVFSKYVLSYSGILVAGTLVCLAKTIFAVIKQQPPQPEIYPAVLLTACVATLMSALVLPIMFKLGVEKGRLVFFALLAIVTFGGVLLGKQILAGLAMVSIGLVPLLGLALAVTIAVNFISIRLATVFYKNRG